MNVGYEFSGLVLASYQSGRYAEGLSFLEKSGPTVTGLSSLIGAAMLCNIKEPERAARTLQEVSPYVIGNFAQILRARHWSEDIIEKLDSDIRGCKKIQPILKNRSAKTSPHSIAYHLR
ncbi:hypothetical protein [Martelella mangrovi]|uniref:Uncharacterized protein n=1 Tax=Martelella mangrovi TaxID=1397477 RepID=A0ABV2I8Y0_9HYPH